jgi:hypothetical protein
VRNYGADKGMAHAGAEALPGRFVVVEVFVTDTGTTVFDCVFNDMAFEAGSGMLSANPPFDWLIAA